MRNFQLIARLFVLVLLSILSMSALADTKDHKIAIITWRGETAAEHSFKKKLKSLGVQAQYEHFDADRSQTDLAGFLRENQASLNSMDLIYTFGTTATLTIHNFDFSDVPHVFNIVSDPVGVGLANSLEEPRDGITGAKMSLDPLVILKLLDPLYPYETVGVLFDPREENAVAQLASVSNSAEELGKSVVQLRFAPDGDEMEKQTSSLRTQAEKVDVVFVAAASSFFAHSHLLGKIIPEDTISVGASSAYVGNGISLAFGPRYGERGEAAASLAAKILLDDAAPSSLAINEVKASDAIIFINKSNKAAKNLDLAKALNEVEYK